MGGEDGVFKPYAMVCILILFFSAGLPPLRSGGFPTNGPISVLNYFGNVTAERDIIDELGQLNGWAVTHVNASTFRSMSEADLRQHDVLIVISGGAADAPCGTNQWGGPLDFSGLLSNPRVGAAVQTGRKVITTLDPDWHGAFVHTGEMPLARRFLSNAVGWVGNGSATGYVALVDGHYCSGWWTSPGSYLKSLLESPGVGVVYEGLTEAEVTDVSHPVTAGLPSTISYCCHHARIQGTLPGFRYVMVHPTSRNGLTAVQDESAPPNQAPAVTSFSASAAFEGSPVVYSVMASDPDGDALHYAFDFEGDGSFDSNTTSSGASHVFGDDFAGVARVRVSDGRLSTDASTNVLVTNLAPSVSFAAVPSFDEASPGDFIVQMTDPGSDDLLWRWVGPCPSWTGVLEVSPNNLGIYPDPDPSPEIHPRGESVQRMVRCPDDGTLRTEFRVEDDDGGVATVMATFSVANLPPSLTLPPPSVEFASEGDTVALSASAADEGSDDLTFQWVWEFGPTAVHSYYNNGAGPDPPLSPNGSFPFAAVDTSSNIYGDDGTYTLTLAVSDDDGGRTEFKTSVVVANVAPIVRAGPDLALVEGSNLVATIVFSDPGFDSPSAGTLEDFTAIADWGYGPLEQIPVVETPGGPGTATTGKVDITHTYGDNGEFLVTVTICDDDGGCGEDTFVAIVTNLDPLIETVQVSAEVSVSLRIAGEKWHDVTLVVFDGRLLLASASLVRMPGSPDDQSMTVDSVKVDVLSDAVGISIVYTPDDDPENGQTWGANPAWLLLTSREGDEVRLQHAFNVRHPDTWIWEVPDVRAFLVGFPIDFVARAIDPGSDDLTFVWSWGDGTPTASRTAFNSGVGPDPNPSPDGFFPFSGRDQTSHAFLARGTYDVVLSVEDDDAGLTEFVVYVTL